MYFYLTVCLCKKWKKEKIISVPPLPPFFQHLQRRSDETREKESDRETWSGGKAQSRSHQSRMSVNLSKWDLPAGSEEAERAYKEACSLLVDFASFPIYCSDYDTIIEQMCSKG